VYLLSLTKLRKIAPLLTIIITIVSISIVLSAKEVLIIELAENRELIHYFIEYSYNPYIRVSALAPAIVNSIIWDFRGLDTLYETIVFYTSIIAALSLYYGLVSSSLLEKKKLSPIAMTVLRIASIVAMTVAIATALRGHITPGGGFQGGAILAVLLFLCAITYSAYGIEMKGLKLSKLIIIRSLGLLMIVITIVAPLIVGLATGTTAYLFQNQYKPNSIGSLIHRINGEPVTGVLPVYNIFEMLIVVSGFAIILLLFSIADYSKK